VIDVNEIFIILSTMGVFFLSLSIASWRENRKQSLEKKLRVRSSTASNIQAGRKPDLATLLLNRWRWHRREHILESQLEGTLLDMAAALWANPSLKEAFEAAKTEAQEPLRSELDRVLKEIECGIGVDTALASFLDRNRSGALKVAVHAMLICRETGGNLAPVLERTADLIRSRLLLKSHIRALTSQQRTTALVVSLVPVAFLVLTQILNPGYLNYLFTPLGTLLMLYSVISISAGFLVLTRMADLLPKGD
jgi:tight adherence protein B